MPSLRLRLCHLPILLAVWLLPAARLSAQPNAWTSLGPFGGTVASLAFNPNNLQVIYASADQGIFRSLDAGNSWRLLPGSPGGGQVALDTGRPKVLYATSPSPLRVFRSADGGSNWTAVSRDLPLGSAPTAFAVEPSPATRIHVGTFGRGILRSLDGGVTWKGANQGLSGLSLFIHVLLVPPRGPSGTVLAGTRDGLYRTVDGGASWSRLGQGLPAVEVSALAVSPNDPRTLYAGLGGFGIYRSVDGGASWTPTAASPAEISLADSLAVHPRSPRTVYAGSFYGSKVFKSTDGGAHWTVTALPSGIRVRTLGFSPSGLLYAGAAAPRPDLPGIDPGGILRSADGGRWTRVNQGLASLTTPAIALDPGDPGVLLAGQLGPGLFLSADRGAHWTRTDFGLPALSNSGAQVAKIVATAPGVFHALNSTDHSLETSTDGGLTWSPLPDAGEVFNLLADPVEPRTLYVLNTEGLARSTDGGASWIVLSMPLLDLCELSELAVVRPSVAQPAVFWAVGSRPAPSCGDDRRAGVFRSLDLGASWVEMNAGLPDGPGRSVATIAAAPDTPHTLYLGMGDGADGVWKSTDDGASWRPAGLGGFSVLTLAFTPAPGVLWAGAPGRIFRTANGGATWEDRSGKLPLHPWSLRFDPVDRRLYAAGSTGVWVSPKER